MNMGSNTGTYVGGTGSGILSGAVAGASIGSYAGGYGAVGGLIGGALGGALGLWGADEQVKINSEQEQWRNQVEPTTDYQVTLPSGATVTMYARGKKRAQPTGTASQLPAAGLAALQTAGTLYGDKTAKPVAGSGTTVNSAQANVTNGAFTPGEMYQVPANKPLTIAG
jgi:hypothetical protein